MAEMSKPATFTVDGIPQAFVSECEVDVQSEDKPVKTLPQGLVGYSDGAEMARVTFKGAIPLNGRELDYKDRAINHTTSTIGVRMGSKTITVEGRFSNVRERSSVDNPNEIDGTFEGRVVSNL